MPFAHFEQGQHRRAAVGGDLERAALEAGCPEVEPLDGLEPEMRRVPRGRLGSVGHADVYVVESAHAERGHISLVSHRASPLVMTPRTNTHVTHCRRRSAA